MSAYIVPIVTTALVAAGCGLVWGALYTRFFGPRLLAAKARGDSPPLLLRGIAAGTFGTITGYAAQISADTAEVSRAIPLIIGIVVLFGVYLRDVFAFDEKNATRNP